MLLPRAPLRRMLPSTPMTACSRLATSSGADSRTRRGLLLAIVLPLAGCAGSTVPVSAGARTAGMQAAPAAVARDAAADLDDPVAVRLSAYLRLLAPGGGSAAEIARFLAQNPTWPNRALLQQRLDQAIAAETDPVALGTVCGSVSPGSAASLLRCAGIVPATIGSTPGLPDAGLPDAGLSDAVPPALVAAAREAWVHGIDGSDQAASFLRVWGRFLTAGDQERRFDRLEWAGNAEAAGRTLPLLPPSDQPLAAARLALRRNAPDADAVASSLPTVAAHDPVLVLELARWLRRRDRIDSAVSLWRGDATAAEARIGPDRLGAFWTERDALARALLGRNRDADAFAIADDRMQSEPGPRLDAGFLAGWIALQRLRDPVGAEARFAPLEDATAVITRSRGAYWTGRARLARGDAPGAASAFSQAAAYPTTFYGQLAAARLQPPAPGPAMLPAPGPAMLLAPGTATLLAPDAAKLSAPAAADPVADRLRQLRDPRWTQAEAIRFAGLELARASELLVAWNDRRHARAFLLRLDAMATNDTAHALAASLADRLGLPDVAVAIARAAGRHGLVLRGSGWPEPFTPPEGGLPPGLALAVMRQESSFDPQVTSPAGARGLMQLTTGTARDTARAAGRPDLAGGGAILFDPEANMTLGTAYLDTLLARFGGVVPYAVAAYNAGPHRVDQWLAASDPARAPAPGVDPQDGMIDWIEEIPYAETRNYVQRVMENMAVYRAGPASRA